MKTSLPRTGLRGDHCPFCGGGTTKPPRKPPLPLCQDLNLTNVVIPKVRPLANILPAKRISWTFLSLSCSLWNQSVQECVRLVEPETHVFIQVARKAGICFEISKSCLGDVGCTELKLSQTQQNHLTGAKKSENTTDFCSTWCKKSQSCGYVESSRVRQIWVQILTLLLLPAVEP